MTSTRFVLFGSTGDLARRKIIPALIRLQESQEVVFDEIIAVGRRNLSTHEYCDLMGVNQNKLPQLLYNTIDLHELSSLQAKQNTVRTIWYLALPRSSYNTVISSLAPIVNNDDLILIEKPVGYDTQSVQEIITHIKHNNLEQQVRYIDHYRGKGLIQALSSEEVCECISHISTPYEVSVQFSETLNVADRADTFDESGIVRDVVQNHLLQLIGITYSKYSEDRIALFDTLTTSIESADTSSWIRAQYEGYRDHEGVEVNSVTETFIYFSVPIVHFSQISCISVSAGKNLSTSRVAEELFNKEQKIILEVQPHAQIIADNTVQEFAQPYSSQDAYDVLLSSSYSDKRDFFVTSDELLASWRVTDALLKKMYTVPLTFYQPHTTPFQQ